MARTTEDNSLMGQYNSIKAKHPDAILLFRVGDFYETFGDDAIKTSGILGITLTSRNNGYASAVELAGFPHHALETYLPKLVRAGQRVAICDQLEDPKMAKGIVKRGITELVTPGVAISDNVLEIKENNFLGCVHIDRNNVGIAFLDISTGEFLVGEGSADYADRILATFKPKEVLYEKGKRQAFMELFGTKWLTYPFDDWAFEPSSARQRLVKQFETQSLKGFGVEGIALGTTAAGAIMHYLDITEHDRLKHINKLTRIEGDNYVWLDRFTVRNLELFPSGIDGTTSLFDIMDKTHTPMGARMLRRWMSLPQKDRNIIENRLDSVWSLGTDEDANGSYRDQLDEILASIGDLERLAGKASTMRITPREMLQLKRTLFSVTPIRQMLSNSSAKHMRDLAASLSECIEMRERIEHEISPEAPTTIAKGGAIANGVNEELDMLRHISSSSKDYLNEMQERLINETGITSLKVGFNNVFGYYIEVRNTHKDKVPEEWIRKQTLANAERYITTELKEYEEKILHADENIMRLEQQIFNDLILYVCGRLGEIQRNASILSEIDVLLSFRIVADANGYCRPEVNDGEDLDITDGRHPVIERLMADGESYIANSIHLDRREQQIIIITGPNMAGKSALLRQTALIVLMAQMGSFVPATEAHIGIVDKIFTRVGASDNISQGESTFMVEMTEAANILNNVTPRSLVLFDELGRGTSTYDGISLAWSIVEYLHNNERAQAKTLFATHYHELNEMQEKYGRIRNFNVSVKEIDGKVIFMRKLVEGGSEHSFGIHVAKLAGMPKVVVSRAGEILRQLENAHQGNGQAAATDTIEPGMQLSFFQLDDPVLSQIRDEIQGLDINNLTPLEALNKLNDIKRLIGVK